MAIRAPSSVFMPVERLLAHRQWRSNYVCARCLHTSRPHLDDAAKSEIATTGQPSPSSRRARAVKVSQDLADIGGFGGSTPSQPASESAITSVNGSDRSVHKSGRSSSSKPSDSPQQQQKKPRNPFEAGHQRESLFSKPSIDKLLQSGNGTATPAGAGYQAVVRDRLKLAMRPGVETSTFSHNSPVRAVALGQFTEEQGYTAAQDEPRADTKERYAQFIGETYVAGDYGGDRVLHYEPDKKHSTMDVIEKAMVMNSTYLRKDGLRFMEKVTSLMPVARKSGPSKPPKAARAA